jgi:serine protease Do
VVNISTTQKVAAGRHPGLPEGLQIPDMPEGPLGDLFRHFFGEGGPGGGPGAPGNGPWSGRPAPWAPG